MHRVSKILFVSVTSVALTSGIALADKRGSASSGDDSAASGETSTAKPDASESTDSEPTKDSWPKAGIERPLTAAKGMLEVTPMGTFGHSSAGDASVNTEGVTLAARYGLSSKLELGASYTGITFNPESNFKGALAVGLGFQAIHGAAGGKLDIAPKAAFIYDFAGQTGVIDAGADVRYKITPKLYVGTPTNVPGLGVTVKGADVMGTSATPIVFAVPVAVGLQATDALQLQASTIVANFSIKDSATTYITDITPLTIDALFALGNKMDVRIDLNLLDLQHAGDAIGVAAGLNVRL